VPISQRKIGEILNKKVLPKELSLSELAEFCEFANAKYRDGNPIISDQDYDFIYLKALKDRSPDHIFFKSIEPEIKGFSEEKSILPEAMLSIDKAYSFDEILKWVDRILKSCKELSYDPRTIILKATPKLDGFAGYDDGIKLYTRGDGKKGSDISRVFQRGLKIFNDTKRGQGPGEIVVKKSYFEKHLSHLFEFPRNFQASLIKEKGLDKHAKNAIKNDGAFFVPFNQLPYWKGAIEELKKEFEIIVKKSLESVDFDVDGVVFEVLNDEIKSHMGSNRKFIDGRLHLRKIKIKHTLEFYLLRLKLDELGKLLRLPN